SGSWSSRGPSTCASTSEHPTPASICSGKPAGTTRAMHRRRSRTCWRCTPARREHTRTSLSPEIPMSRLIPIPLRILLASGLVLAAGAASAARVTTPNVGVGAQYDTTHVYIAPDKVDAFVNSLIETFGGKSTPQAIATVTPTPSSSSIQLVFTPVGTFSVFGFRTPVPAPFGSERTGYLVTDMDAAVRAARDSGAEVVVAPFPDAVGRDTVIRWAGGVNMQLYWH